MAGRNPLGFALQNAIRPPSPFNPSGDLMSAPAQPQGKGLLGGKGAMLAGILGDALSQASGGQAVVLPQMLAERERARRSQEEEAQWTRRRTAQNQDWMAHEQWKLDNKPPEVSPMERDLKFWQGLDPAGQAAYRAMQAAKPQFIPDGMGGGQWVTVPGGGAPAAPPGPPPGVTFTPLDNGGPTPPASGGFRP